MARAHKKAAAEADETVDEYVVLTPIEHDHELYDVGDPILLGRTHARPLLDTNPPSIKAAGKSKFAEPDAGGGSTTE